MCGIFAIFSNSEESKEGLDYEKCDENAMTIQYRGPDKTTKEKHQIGQYESFLVFHRLMINDQTELGNQPMHIDDNVILMCNGEIYNHKYLEQKYGITPKSRSDCEVIGHLYNKLGFEEMTKQIDGLFATVLIDTTTNTVYINRDPIGVRPLYFGQNETTFAVASELRALMGLGLEIQQFPPGHIWNSTNKQFIRYYDNTYGNLNYKNLSLDYMTKKMYRLLKNAVKNQLESDRPIGCLLSGGIDSSSICALVNLCKTSTEPLHTFSIGLPDSSDLKFSRIVAEHIRSIHTEVVVSEKELLDAIPEVVNAISSIDITSCRASVPMYLLAKYISEKTNIKCLFSGESADEILQGYLYFHNAPSQEESGKESMRLVNDLAFFDVLRVDRCLSHFGLECRVPFLDTKFVDFCMKLDPKERMPKTYGIEKYLLRKAGEVEENFLPKIILSRSKEAFSDGISPQTRGWYQIIQEMTEAKYTDEEFQQKVKKYTHCPPRTKEGLYYRELFEQFYPGMAYLTPYFWLPKWNKQEVIDPSARVLDIYKQVMK